MFDAFNTMTTFSQLSNLLFSCFHLFEFYNERFVCNIRLRWAFETCRFDLVWLQFSFWFDFLVSIFLPWRFYVKVSDFAARILVGVRIEYLQVWELHKSLVFTYFAVCLFAHYIFGWLQNYPPTIHSYLLSVHVRHKRSFTFASN